MLLKLLRIACSVLREGSKVVTRSSGWPTARKHHLKAQPYCAACGGTTLLQVHHMLPFHLDPQLELDQTNLITLCMGTKECHLVIGHGGDFHHYNPNVLGDAQTVLNDPSKFAAVKANAEATRKPL